MFSAGQWLSHGSLSHALGLTVKAAVGFHGCLIGGAAAFIAFPKPWTRPGRNAGTPEDDNLSFEDVTLADGCVGWLVHGRAGSPAVCLCHGRSRHKAHLRPLIRALAPEYTVLACDFRGHGDNAYGPTTLGQTEALTVDLALDLLAERGFDRVLLYGCSMGGAAALISQAQRPHPSVRGIVTDGTFAVFSELIEQKGQWLPRCMRGYMSTAVLHSVENQATVVGNSWGATRTCRLVTRSAGPLPLGLSRCCR